MSGIKKFTSLVTEITGSYTAIPWSEGMVVMIEGLFGLQEGTIFTDYLMTFESIEDALELQRERIRQLESDMERIAGNKSKEGKVRCQL